MNKLQGNNVLHANILYLILGLLFIFFGSIVQSKEIYSGLLITEYIIILVPNIIYLKTKELSLKKTLKLNRISVKQAIYIIGIAIFSYPIAVFLNLLAISILSLFGTPQQSAVPIPDTPNLYLISLFVISITPAICEEVMFRGTIMNAYENVSKKKAVIYSAILFGVFHLNIQNLLGPTFLGIIFGIVVYKTGSIYASIIGHALNNAIAITIGYFVTRVSEGLLGGQQIPSEIENSFQGVQMISSIVVIGLFALVSFRFLKKLLKEMPKSENGEMVFEEVNREKSKSTGLLHYLPAFLFVIIFLYINIKLALI